MPFIRRLMAALPHPEKRKQPRNPPRCDLQHPAWDEEAGADEATACNVDARGWVWRRIQIRTVEESSAGRVWG